MLRKTGSAGALDVGRVFIATWRIVTCVVCGVKTPIGRMVALVRKGGDTTTRGLKLRLRDLGKIWVSAFWLSFGPWEPAAAKQHLTLSKGRTRHPQPLQPPSRSRAPEQKVDDVILALKKTAQNTPLRYISEQHKMLPRFYAASWQPCSSRDSSECRTAPGVDRSVE